MGTYDVISEEHVNEVCKIGQGADCCRYLMMTPDGFECGKVTLSVQAMFDQRVAAGMMTAQGDNCEGKPKP